MKKIYVVLANPGALLSRIIRLYTGAEYSHVSIALDEDLNEMYSMGRKYSYIAFLGGVVKEGTNFGAFKRFYKTQISVYEVEVTTEQYNKVVETIEYVKTHKDEYKFNILGLIYVLFNKKRQKEKTYYCAEFVRAVLKKANIDTSYLPDVIRPEHFQSLNNSNLIYKGLFRTYKYRNKSAEFIEYLNFLFAEKKAV